jgi:acetyl-CoA acetyltransferase
VRLDDIAISGVGYAEITRDSERSEAQLAVDACRAAVADAGLERDRVDGLAMFPNRTSPPTAFQGPPIPVVQRALALRLRYRSSGSLDAQFGTIFDAMRAVATGTCTHVLVYRAHKRQSRRYLPAAESVARGFDEEAYTLPYGAGSGAARLAPWAARHMHVYGTTQRHLGAVVLNCRAHAASNPRAIWRDVPLDMDAYLASRWISTPFKVLDCDYPVDGAVAVVVSRASALDRQPRPVVRVESIGSSPGNETSWTQWPDYASMAAHTVGARLWESSRFAPADVEVAELYDGFSWLAIGWLEGLGFVPEGHGGPFFADGRGRIGSGDLPVCTDGGQLGGGRLHGFGKVAQAVAQLRDEAGANQVAGASIAIASAGGGPSGGAMVLTTEVQP